MPENHLNQQRGRFSREPSVRVFDKANPPAHAHYIALVAYHFEPGLYSVVTAEGAIADLKSYTRLKTPQSFLFGQTTFEYCYQASHFHLDRVLDECIAHPFYKEHESPDGRFAGDPTLLVCVLEGIIRRATGQMPRVVYDISVDPKAQMDLPPLCKIPRPQRVCRPIFLSSPTTICSAGAGAVSRRPRAA